MAKHPVLLKRLSAELRLLFRRFSKRLARPQAKQKLSRAIKFQGPQSPRSASSGIAHGVRTKHQKGIGSHNNKVKPVNGPDKPQAKGNSIWSSLFLVHPWLLVGGLWLSFIAMIAVALVGLSSPGRELVLDPVPNTIDPPLSAPDVAAASRLSLEEDGARVNSDPAAINPSDTAGKDMPALPLLLMVLACAGGCMLMSRNGALVSNDAMSRRSQRRGVSGAGMTTSRPGPKTTTIGKSGRQRRKQRRVSGQRPAAQVMQFRVGHQLRHTTSSRPRPGASSTKPVSFSLSDQPAKPVTVVPDEESSPLDWKDGSLAHRLDVRQKRSLNSYL